MRLKKPAAIAALRLTYQGLDIALLVLLTLLFLAMPAHAQTPPAPLGLDDMMANFIQNVNMPILQITYAGCYIFGTYLFMKGFFKCVKYSDEGSKGQQKFSGIWGTFLVAGALIALPSMVGDVSDSLLFTNYASGGQAALNYVDPNDPTNAVGLKLKKTYWVIVTFVQMVGLISFVRGLSILRSVTDGNTQVTSMAAITHILAGAIAWNIGDFIQVVGDTDGCSGILTLACNT